ncbi:MAG: leucine-rich repeat domain-containing protein [Clostridia bacterium]|nr:leucine-rich repeat domain-containing protein [Clostridia bacterium]
MKKLICLVLALTALFALTACNDEINPDVKETEPTTVQAPTEGETTQYKYLEYADHIELTDFKGNPTNVYLPKDINGKPVTSFGKIFKASLTLISISIPANSSYTTIESEAFAECQNLTNVSIGNVETIESKAFYGCQSLKVARISDTVTEIAQDAFKYCTELIVYGTPGSAAEEYCEGFNSIYFRDSKAQEETTTAATSEETSSTEESSTNEEESSTAETTTKKKVSTTKRVTTAAPATITAAPEETTRSLLNIFDLP